LNQTAVTVFVSMDLVVHRNKYRNFTHKAQNNKLYARKHYCFVVAMLEQALIDTLVMLDSTRSYRHARLDSLDSLDKVERAESCRDEPSGIWA